MNLVHIMINIFDKLQTLKLPQTNVFKKYMSSRLKGYFHALQYMNETFKCCVQVFMNYGSRSECFFHHHIVVRKKDAHQRESLIIGRKKKMSAHLVVTG